MQSLEHGYLLRDQSAMYTYSSNTCVIHVVYFCTSTSTPFNHVIWAAGTTDCATEKMQSPQSHIKEGLSDHRWTSLEETKLVLRQGRWIADDKAWGIMFAFDKATLLLCLLGGIHWVLCDDVDIHSATASEWDGRDETDSGCGPVGEEGCGPLNTIDEDLNDVPGSRWSCHDDLGEESSQCFITWELPSLHSLDNITIYFYKSDEPDRHTNGFNLSTSADGDTFSDVADGLASIIPTPLGEGNTYDLSASESAVYVRMTGTNSDQEWLSVCEAQICGIPANAGPTPVTTSAPTAYGLRFPTPPPSPAASGSVFASSFFPVAPTLPPGVPSPVATVIPTSPGGIAPSPANGDGGGEDNGDDDDDDGAPIAIIVGCLCGGVALLVLVGLGVGYRVRKSKTRAPAPPPPSYDVVVGTAPNASGK